MLATLLVNLVSAEAISAYLTSRDLPVPEDAEKAANLVVRSSGAKTQGEVAALVVNLTKANITGAQLTEVLKAAFPSDKVGDRHGPYYLSLCRTGKIKVDVAPAKKVGSPKGGETSDQVARALDHEKAINAELEAKVAALEARIAAALACTSAKDIKAALG